MNNFGEIELNSGLISSNIISQVTFTG